jgi:hypothetical protein
VEQNDRISTSRDSSDQSFELHTIFDVLFHPMVFPALFRYIILYAFSKTFKIDSSLKLTWKLFSTVWIQNSNYLMVLFIWDKVDSDVKFDDKFNETISRG